MIRFGNRPQSKNQCLGFTLIEMLVVIAIIALLMSLLTPVVGSARAKAQQIGCQSNMRQYHIAFMAIANDDQGRLPVHFYGTSTSFPFNFEEDYSQWGQKLDQENLISLEEQASRMRCPSNKSTPNSAFTPSLYAYSSQAGAHFDTSTRMYIRHTVLSMPLPSNMLLLADAGVMWSWGSGARCAFSVNARQTETSEQIGFDVHNGANILFLDGRIQLVRREAFLSSWTCPYHIGKFSEAWSGCDRYNR